MVTDATSASGYVAATVIAAAIEAVNGKVDDKNALLTALQGRTRNPPLGHFRFDQKQNVIFDLWLPRSRPGTGLPPYTIDKLAGYFDHFWQ